MKKVIIIISTVILISSCSNKSFKINEDTPTTIDNKYGKPDMTASTNGTRYLIYSNESIVFEFKENLLTRTLSIYEYDEIAAAVIYAKIKKDSLDKVKNTKEMDSLKLEMEKAIKGM